MHLSKILYLLIGSDRERFAFLTFERDVARLHIYSLYRSLGGDGLAHAAYMSGRLSRLILAASRYGQGESGDSGGQNCDVLLQVRSPVGGRLFRDAGMFKAIAAANAIRQACIVLVWLRDGK